MTLARHPYPSVHLPRQRRIETPACSRGSRALQSLTEKRSIGYGVLRHPNREPNPGRRAHLQSDQRVPSRGREDTTNSPGDSVGANWQHSSAPGATIWSTSPIRRQPSTLNSQLKSQYLLDPKVVFLNHGSFGACPRPVFQAYQAWQRELESQPVAFLGRRATDLLAENGSPQPGRLHGACLAWPRG